MLEGCDRPIHPPKAFLIHSPVEPAPRDGGVGREVNDQEHADGYDARRGNAADAKGNGCWALIQCCHSPGCSDVLLYRPDQLFAFVLARWSDFLLAK